MQHSMMILNRNISMKKTIPTNVDIGDETLESMGDSILQQSKETDTKCYYKYTMECVYKT